MENGPVTSQCGEQVLVSFRLGLLERLYYGASWRIRTTDGPAEESKTPACEWHSHINEDKLLLGHPARYSGLAFAHIDIDFAANTELAVQIDARLN